MTLLEYPITRSIPLRRFWSVLIVLGAVAWILIITLVNVAVVGYEVVPIISTSYSDSSTLWYEHILPMSSWIPRRRTCDWSVIKLMEGKTVTTDG